MPRIVLASALLLAFAAVSLGLTPAPQQAKAPSPAPAPQTREPNPIIQLAKKLNERVDYDGIDDNKATLLDVLAQLHDKFKLSFEVNEMAFKAEGTEDVLSTPVAGRPIPKMHDVKLATVLKRVLSRVPIQSGITFIIREDGV